ncbi:acetylserotonin O-methyltransferase 1-like [Aegilops tauschii subsp. strangulata]|uniref:O-methyltransferase ZRP4 n=1 Tax=Aegilops tauschii TaxID=37682 RepID=N1QYA9_AEGTA
MTLKLLAEVSPQELLGALAELHNHMIGYVKCMSLRCAVDLGIPDAIHHRGGTATLAHIATDTKVHPAKVADLERVMELLTTSGIFTRGAGVGDAAVYGLTTACRILVGWRNLSPMVPFLVNPLAVSSFFSMPQWFRSEPMATAAGSLFELEHGCSQWEMVSKDAVFNDVLNHSMAADSQLFLEVVIMDKGRIFRGLGSLVDVGGGNGAGTKVIAKAFTRITCTVLDLPHVVGQAAGDGNLRFVAVLSEGGRERQQHESIPPADAVVLKQAIPARNAGGKVIIIDMVRGSALGVRKISEMEATQNVFMMYIFGVEQDESEWKRIFSDAGFNDNYKIMPILGPYSVIEIYP